MFVSYSREKLLNAIIYFVENTKYCHTLKLFKLLNFLDFEHFRQTGRSVTGQSYRAWPNGPAPNQLWHELEHPTGDLLDAVAVWKIKDDITDKTLLRVIKAKRKFDSKYFSKRELDILETLAFYFKESRADDMSELSHLPGLPWFIVYKRGEGKGKDIPYELALKCSPIIELMPTLDEEEYEYKKDALAEVRSATNDGQRS